jgi:hypothetical protein
MAATVLTVTAILFGIIHIQGADIESAPTMLQYKNIPYYLKFC